MFVKEIFMVKPFWHNFRFAKYRYVRYRFVLVNMKIINKRKTIAVLTSLLGFMLILINGIGYTLMWDISTPELLITGIAFFLFGGFASNKPMSEQTN